MFVLYGSYITSSVLQRFGAALASSLGFTYRRVTSLPLYRLQDRLHFATI
jgi:hypothetical protein